jgi:uncharacterized membrane protein
VLAAVMSLTTVFMEVARKKAVAGRSLLPVLFWCHGFDTIVFVLAWSYYRSRGYGFFVRGGDELFGLTGLPLTPLMIYLIYQLVDQVVHSVANWLFFKALQEGAMSTAIPFLAFTSVLLIPTGFLLLGELPSAAKLIGVLLATTGGVAMHWRLFAVGWTAPFKAVYQNKGSRYMLYVAMLLAILTPLDKKLSVMTDLYSQTVIYGASMTVCFYVMCLLGREALRPALRGGLGWIALAGTLDAAALILQFASYQYTDVVIVISIKRAGIVLAVVFGWLFFREKHIQDKLMAASVIFAGVSILYLPLTLLQAAITALVTVTLMVIFMRATHRGPRESLLEAAPGQD